MDRIAEILNRYIKPEQSTTVLLETPNERSSYVKEIAEVRGWEETAEKRQISR
jgi:hypothetical protein